MLTLLSVDTSYEDAPTCVHRVPAVLYKAFCPSVRMARAMLVPSSVVGTALMPLPAVHGAEAMED